MISTTNSGSDQPERLDAVDALRGIAFLCVLLVHSAQSVAARHGAVVATKEFFGQRLANAGAFGVSLFFIASAFTLFASHRQRRESAPVSAFFIRRVFRIVPLFWAGILFYFLIYGVWNRNWAEGTLGLFHFGLTATILHGWHPDTINSVVPGGWSIAAEFGFYAMAPFLFNQITDLRRAVVAYFIALLVALTCNHFARAGLVAMAFPDVPAWRQHSFTYLWLPTHLPTFLLGFIAFHARKPFQNINVCVRVLLFIADIALLLCAAQWLRNDSADYVFPLLLAVFVLLILSMPVRPMVNRFTCLLGVLSFSAYITHFASVKVLEKFLARAPSLSNENYLLLTYLGALGMTIGISWITYRVIEQPGIQLGRRIIQAQFRLPQPGPSATSA